MMTTETSESFDGLAIIGMAGRFPGAMDIDAFWDMLKEGKEGITFFSKEELLEAGIAQDLVDQTRYVRAKGVLKDIALFDADFFGYTPREAEFMDPQQRVFLECAWHALENAGCDPKRYPGPIAIFGGGGNQSYLHYILNHSDNPEQRAEESHVFFGNYRDFMMTRTAYKLDLRGPAVTIQTACSTSLVAINNACQSLLNYECDMALAGGCSITVPEKSGYLYEPGGIVSPDGHCRAFSEDAMGTLRGDGCGIVVLKRLEEALAEGDFIHAVIRGFAVNNDGSDKIGFTAPGVAGQREVITLAQEMAGGKTEWIGYMEAHGTGTPMGDAVEMSALTMAFRKTTDKKGFCRIGSVKTNVGHLDAAAGVTGVIKTVLSLEKEEIPPSLHCNKPSPGIHFADSPFIVNTRLSPWKRGPEPRRAGVSAFGIGGTNCHIVLEEAPLREATHEEPPPNDHLILISAKDEAALEEATENLRAHLNAHPGIKLQDVAFTLQVGRGEFEFRRFIVCRDREDFLTAPPARIFTGKKESLSPIFTFPGQERYYNGMGKDLYAREPHFRQELDACCEILSPILGCDIRSLLFGASGTAEKTLAEPLLFVLEYALGKVILSWGIKPKAMMGHGVGEYAAAALGGLFSLEEAFRMIVQHGAPAEPDLDSLSAFLKNITFHSPKISLIAGSTGHWMTDLEVCSPDYWIDPFIDPLRRSAQVARGFTALLENPTAACVEVGPASPLDQSTSTRVVSCLPPPESKDSDQATLYAGLGRLWLMGAEIDWSAFYRDRQPRRLPLPLYPFRKTRHWFTPVTGVKKSRTESKKEARPVVREEAPEKVGNMFEWFWLPVWKRSVPLLPGPHKEEALWLFFEDQQGVTPALVHRCLQEGGRVVRVRRANSFASLPDGSFRIDPRKREDFVELLKRVGDSVAHVVYCWALDEGRSPWDYYSDLFLMAQALGPQKDPLCLSIISSGMQSLDPEEDVKAEKATLMGPARVIPLEYSHIRCRSIDLAPPLTDGSLIESLFAELAVFPQEPVVAYRDGRRFVQGYETCAPEIKPSRFIAGGVYLITGGLGGVGMAVAQYLAKNYQAKLALLSRSALPDRSEWDAWLLPGVRVNRDGERKNLAHQESEFRAAQPIKGIGAYPGLEARLIAFCCALAYEFLAQEGRNVKPEVFPEGKPFFQYLIDLLTQQGFASREGEDYSLTKAPPGSMLLLQELRGEFPGFEGLYRLLAHCAFHYGPFFSGDLPGIEVLYPEGKYDFLEACEAATIPYSQEPVYRRLLTQLVERLTGASQRPLRILEVGGGNGILTWEVIDALKGRKAEYHFTDLGNSFVIKARERADRKGFDFMRFSVLDISRSGEEQGMEAGSFDMILGMNVVHATTNMEETLFYLERLLAPEGVLGLIESVKPYPWVDMIWGLTKGWWYFDDYPLRTVSPLLSIAQWETLLAGRCYNWVETFPIEPRLREETDCALIVAHKNGNPEVEDSDRWQRESSESQKIRYRLEEIQALEEAGGEVLVCRGDVSKREQMQGVMTAITERFGGLNGVIHAALILNDGLMQLTDPLDAKAVMEPKIEGTQLLYALTEPLKPDFFALFSSLASVTGTYAQSAYCAAGAYQDAFAYAAKTKGSVPVVAIDWGLWRDTGAAMRTLMRKVILENSPRWVKHPFYRYRKTSTGAVCYHGVLSFGDDWIVREHRLRDEAVVPGTALLEMAVAAFRDYTGKASCEMREVYFLRPLKVPREKGIAFQTLLKKEAEGYRFTIRSREECATGFILALDEQAREYDLEALKKLCPGEREVSTSDSGFKQVGPVLVGPHWNSVHLEIRHGKNQALAFVALDPQFKDELPSFSLHPALLDISANFALGSGDFYLPFSYGDIKIYAPLPGACYVYARYLEDSTSGKESLSYQLSFFDEQGKLCVEIEDYTLRKVLPEDINLSETNELGPLPIDSPLTHPDLKEGMSAEEGARAFELALAFSSPQVLVTPQNLNEILQRNQTGKVIRNKEETLEEFLSAEQRIDKTKVSRTGEHSDLEGDLREIWSEVLGIEEIGPDDDFFDLKGDSILAIMVATRIRSRLHVEMTPDILFRASTIRSLAKKLRGQGKDTPPAAPGKNGSAGPVGASDLRSPISLSQERMWFLNQNVPSDDIYIIPGVYRISGLLDLQALKRCLEALIARHDALRTDFALDAAGRPVQIIRVQGSLNLEQKSLLFLPEAKREPEALKIVTAELKRPFRFPGDSPLRFLLIQLKKDEHILLINMHNLIGDGWSIGILNRDLSALYGALRRGELSPLTPLKLNYGDFAIGQAERFQGDALDRETRFWRERLQSIPQTILPYDIQPREGDLRRGKQISWRFPEGLYARLKAFNRTEGSTMFRTLCVVYGLLISLNTQQEMVSILTPYSNRDQEGLEDVIGNFVAALPVSVACSRDAGFQDILQEFKKLYLVLTSHTAMPFERLSKEFDFLARPLTMVEFIYHNYPQRPIRFDDLEVIPVDVDVETAGYDMELHLWDTHNMDTGERENKGELRAEFYYNCSCFRESTARNVPGCFQSLLEAVIADPRRPLSQLEEGLYRIKRERRDG